MEQPKSLEEALKILEAQQKKIIAYDKQKQRMKNYQKKNPEVFSEKSKKYYNKLKEEKPEKYNELKEQRRLYYHEVAKPRKALEKAQVQAN